MIDWTVIILLVSFLGIAAVNFDKTTWLRIKLQLNLQCKKFD